MNKLIAWILMSPGVWILSFLLLYKFFSDGHDDEGTIQGTAMVSTFFLLAFWGVWFLI